MRFCSHSVQFSQILVPLLQITVNAWPKAFQAMRFDSLITNMDIEGSGFVVRDNTMMNNRGRGLLVKASNGVIERNNILGPAWWGMQVRIPSFQGSLCKWYGSCFGNTRGDGGHRERSWHPRALSPLCSAGLYQLLCLLLAAVDRYIDLN